MFAPICPHNHPPTFFAGGENVDEGKRMYGMRADIESSGCRVAVALRSQASQKSLRYPKDIPMIFPKYPRDIPIESSGCRVAVALRSQASQNLSF